jgi:hypothetical protein
MSKDRRRIKNEKRARSKRERHDRLRDLKARVALKTHPCPDCGDDYREDKPTLFHRTGPCGAPKEKIETLNAKIKDIEARWENVQDEDRLPCRSCFRKITHDEESWRDFEGELIWVGCDHCHEINDLRFEDRMAETRLAWPENKARVQEIEKHIEAEAKARFEKFVAPFMKPEDLPPGVTPRPIPAGSLPAGSRSIYDRAMDQPVPWPTTRQGPGLVPASKVIEIPASVESMEKTSVSE